MGPDITVGIYSPLSQMLILCVQILMAVFGSFGALRALDHLSGINFGNDIFHLLKSDPVAMAIYASARFITVCSAMAYLCGRFI